MAEDENILNVPTSVQTSITTFSNESELRRGGIGEKTRVGNREVVITLGTHVKRGRGRPRLTEEEKQRRKELREMGLIKRSKRRTKEGTLKLQFTYIVCCILQKFYSGKLTKFVLLLNEVVNLVLVRRT